MIGEIIIIICFGLYCLGLVTCGIILFIDITKAKKFAKKIQKFFKNFWNTP
jgi:hypothetical protein